MKTRFQRLSILALATFALLLGSCQKEDLRKDLHFNGKSGMVDLSVSVGSESNPESDNGILPAIIPGSNRGGNRTCEEVAAYFSGEFDLSSGKFDYEYNEDEGKWMWKDDHGNYYDEFPFSGINVVVTDNTWVEFDITLPGYCVGAVIVKGGPDANVYYYEDGAKTDSGLASPVNSSGKSAGLSNLTFCLVECDNGQDCEWKGQTAFGGDFGFNVESSGSWWFAFDTEGDSSQGIHAGQKEVDGASVDYDSESDVLTITLGPNMRLKAGSETVKVQGYDELPSSRPVLGAHNRFHAGTNLVINGNGSRYYVIHLDVEVLECK